MEDKSMHPGMNPINDSMLSRESWKIFQIMPEFVEGFERMARVRPSANFLMQASPLSAVVARALWKLRIKAHLKVNHPVLG